MFYTPPMKSRPILYIKSGCPWCDDALAYFSRHNVPLDIRDVRSDPEAMKRMREISGQSLTPTFEYDDFMVADFSVNEFASALNARPEIREKLGIPS